MLEQRTFSRVVRRIGRSLLLWFLPLVVFLGVFGWRVLFSSVPDDSAAPKPIINIPSPEYDKRVATALAVEPDSLDKHFRIEGLNVPTVFSNMSRIEAGRGHLAVIDSGPEPRVYLYDANGHFETQLGRAGSGPGMYVAPTDVALGESLAAVSDFTTKRVSIFSTSGKLSSTFVYGPQGFSATALTVAPTSDGFLLFGNRWPKKPDDQLLFVHRYSSSGQYQGSVFALPPEAEIMRLDVDDQPMVRHVNNEVWFMLPWDYQVFAVSKGGTTRVVFDPHNPLRFRPPSSGPPKTPTLASFQNWSLSWTPIVSFGSDGRILLIETECFCKARFGMDVWSLRTGRLHGQFSTNWKLVGRDDGAFYFSRESVLVGGKRTYEFAKASSEGQ